MTGPRPLSSSDNLRLIERDVVYGLLEAMAVSLDTGTPPSGATIELVSRVASWVHEGRASGYPPCCIRQFVIDMLARKSGHGLMRQRHPHPVDGYVMCDECLAKLDRAWPNRTVKPIDGGELHELFLSKGSRA